MQPQFAQSGLPPSVHGVIRVARSAEMLEVVLAKTHSSGDLGGLAYASISPFGILSFEYRSLSAMRSARTRSRSAGLRRSGEASPICGVYRLIQIFLISFRPDQNLMNSSR